MRAKVAAGAYTSPGYGLPEKRCENFYFEPGSADPVRPAQLLRTPGSVDADPANSITSNIRGFAQADGFASGHVLIVEGTGLTTYDPATGNFSTISGTLAGSDRTQAAFSETEMAMLANGGLYVSDGSTIAAVTDPDFATQLSNHSQSAFSSIAATEQRLVFTYGSRFGFSEGLDFDNTTTLSWYTAEYIPDALVGAWVNGEELILGGSKSIEIWAATGDNDDPFQRQLGRTINRGLLCRDGAQILGDRFVFISNTRDVRLLAGVEAVLISHAAISRDLEAVDPADIITSHYERDGHAFYQINLPAVSWWCDLNVRDDAGMPEWHKRTSLGANTYRWAFVISAAGKQYVAERAGTAFAELSRNYFSEYQADAATLGAAIVRVGSAFLGIKNGFPSIDSVRLEGSRGIGLETGLGADPEIELRVSRGSATTFSSWFSRSLGKIGEYGRRVIWRMLGPQKPPGAVFEFRTSAPVDIVVNGLVVNED